MDVFGLTEEGTFALGSEPPNKVAVLPEEMDILANLSFHGKPRSIWALAWELKSPLGETKHTVSRLLHKDLIFSQKSEYQQGGS